jgi:hypothetical protein
MIQKQNIINYLSLQLPKVTKDLKELEEENMRLQFAIDCFESPEHLMQLVKHEEYTHLRYPSLKEVMVFPEGLALYIEEDSKKEVFHPLKIHPVLAVGAKH